MYLKTGQFKINEYNKHLTHGYSRKAIKGIQKEKPNRKEDIRKMKIEKIQS